MASVLNNHALLLFYSYSACVCVITTGAVSISKMMMVNHSLQLFSISGNNIGDGGISAIAGRLNKYIILLELPIILSGISFILT